MNFFFFFFFKFILHFEKDIRKPFYEYSAFYGVNKINYFKVKLIIEISSYL